MSDGQVEVRGGGPAAGLLVEQRPHVVIQRVGAGVQLLAWVVALLVPLALLRGGPSALLSAVSITLVLHGFGFVLRHSLQRLEVAPRGRVVASGYFLRDWPIPFTPRSATVTSRGEVVVVRERNTWGSHNSPRWVFVVRAVPVAGGSASVPVFRAFDVADAARVAAVLGATLEVPARDPAAETMA